MTLEAKLTDRGWPALALIVLALATPAAWAKSPPSSETASGLVIETFVHETRTHGGVAAELGHLQVPENRERAQSRSIEIVFVRLKGRAVAEGPPIIYLAGGPGGSGIEAGQGARFRLFDALRSSGDVILLDQRGVGHSTRIEPDQCPSEALYPAQRPLDIEPYLALVEEAAAACARFWSERGVDLGAYTTVDSVADLEALRRALDVPQIDLLGISYGSHLAMAYLRAHPERVRRVVLAGAEGPDHTVKLPSQFDAQLDSLQALLDADPRVDPVDVRALVRSVLDRLEREPMTLRIVDVEGPDRESRLVVGGRDIAAITLGMLLDPGSMIQVPALYRRLAAGDFTDVADAVADMRRIGGFEAMPEAMDAASGISPERLRRLRREDESTLLGSGLLLANVAVARGLGVRDLGDEFRGPLEVDTPTLFISGSLDGRTPRSNAEELMRGFSDARQVVVVNGGHSDDLLISSAELERTIVEFFLGEEPGTSEIDLAPPDVARSRTRMALTPRQASRYVGEYERREREIWRILHDQTVESLDANGGVRFANAVLQIRWAGNGFPFHPVSETVFYIDFPWFVDDDFRFELDEAGRVTHLVFEDSEGKTVRAEKVH